VRRFDHRGVQLLRRSRDERRVVSEQLQGLRRAFEHPRDIAARTEQVGQALGHRALVAQQPQVPRRGAEGVGHPPVGQQAAIRIGRVGQVGQDHREQRALQCSPSRQPGGQRLDVAQRASLVAEAQRGKPPARLACGEPEPDGRHPGHCVEQRSVEQLLVQPPDLARVQRPLRVEDGPRVAARIGPKTHRAGQPGEVGRVGRQQMRAPQPP